jgi:hypothetical protein
MLKDPIIRWILSCALIFLGAYRMGYSASDRWHRQHTAYGTWVDNTGRCGTFSSPTKP